MLDLPPLMEPTSVRYAHLGGLRRNFDDGAASIPKMLPPQKPSVSSIPSDVRTPRIVKVSRFQRSSSNGSGSCSGNDVLSSGSSIPESSSSVRSDVDTVEEKAIVNRLVQSILGALPRRYSPIRSLNPASSADNSSLEDCATNSLPVQQFLPDELPIPVNSGDGLVDSFDSIYTEGDFWVEHDPDGQLVVIGHSENDIVPAELPTIEFNKHGGFIDTYDSLYTRGDNSSEGSRLSTPRESLGDPWSSSGDPSESPVQNT